MCIAILPGQYFDAETGLHQNWHREYDPSIGRYLQSDPLGLDGGVSTYGYAYQNPVRFVDPEGLYVCVYSIASHTMVCTPVNPANPPFSSSDFVAGNNLDPKCGDCQDNPDRTNESFHGPLPVGAYVIHKPNPKGRRNLTPNPTSNGRTDFQLHACPKGKRASCSAGCIASENDWKQLTNILKAEEGLNRLVVTP